MLFMTILTWPPERFDDVVAVREEVGKLEMESSEILGEWNDLQGGRYIRLWKSESPDPIDMLKALLAVARACKMETFPVMGTEEVMDYYESTK